MLPLQVFAQEEIITGLEDPCDGEVDRYAAPGAVVVSSTFIDPPLTADLSMYLPAVGDQGKQGSCTAFSVAGALTILSNAKANKTFTRTVHEFDLFYSPAFIFNIAKARYPFPRSENCVDGITFIDAFLVVRDNGIVPASMSRYNPLGNGGCVSSFYPKEQVLTSARKKSINTFQRIDLNLKLFKCLLADKPGYPICIAAKIDQNYKRASDRLDNSTWSTNGPPLAAAANNRHAMLIVGYDDSRKAFKVLDSRGGAKGDNGFIWISYALLDNRTIYDAYVCSFDNDLLKSQRSQGATEDLTEGGTRETWLKENYFRIFNGLQIACVDIDRKNKTVVFEITNANTQEYITQVTLKLHAQKYFEIDGKIFSIYPKEIKMAGRNPFTPAIWFDVSVNSGSIVENVVNKGLFRENLEKLYRMTFIDRTDASMRKLTYLGSAPAKNGMLGHLLDKELKILNRPPGTLLEAAIHNEPFTTTFPDNEVEIFSLDNFIQGLTQLKAMRLDDESRNAFNSLSQLLDNNHEVFKIKEWTLTIDALPPVEVSNQLGQDTEFSRLAQNGSQIVVTTENITAFKGQWKLSPAVDTRAREFFQVTRIISFDNGASIFTFVNDPQSGNIIVEWRGNVSMFGHLLKIER